MLWVKYLCFCFALFVDVNVGFQQAAHRVLIEDDATLSQFNLIIKTKFPLKGATKSKCILSTEMAQMCSC